MIPLGGLLIDRINHRRLLLDAVCLDASHYFGGLDLFYFREHHQISYLFIFAGLSGLTLTVFLTCVKWPYLI